ncbi:MAG: DUF86 domain-containing protein [Ruminococcus sp.]|jgi:uncharacterized protein with HEPN domain|nr:DUF86 domain-containing protein [Ruminococcus sp.]
MKFTLNDEFVKEKAYRHSISMCIMQIGELIKGLDKEFMLENSVISWRDFIGIRNRFAHGYGKMDMEIIWQTSIEDIPKLQEFCTNYERKNNEQDR